MVTIEQIANRLGRLENMYVTPELLALQAQLDAFPVSVTWAKQTSWTLGSFTEIDLVTDLSLSANTYFYGYYVVFQAQNAQDSIELKGDTIIKLITQVSNAPITSVGSILSKSNGNIEYKINVDVGLTSCALAIVWRKAVL